MSLFGTLKSLRLPKPKLAFFGIPKLTRPTPPRLSPKVKNFNGKFFSQEIHGDDLMDVMFCFFLFHFL